MAKLTNKQAAFCLEYMKDFNGAQAAIRAGYSKKTAREIACENLTKPSIRAKIQELKAKQEKKSSITVDEVVDGLKREAKRNKNPGAVRVTAFAHLAKYLGMFDNRTDDEKKKPAAPNVKISISTKPRVKAVDDKAANE